MNNSVHLRAGDASTVDYGLHRNDGQTITHKFGTKFYPSLVL